MKIGKITWLFLISCSAVLLICCIAETTSQVVDAETVDAALKPEIDGKCGMLGLKVWCVDDADCTRYYLVACTIYGECYDPMIRGRIFIIAHTRINIAMMTQIIRLSTMICMSAVITINVRNAAPRTMTASVEHAFVMAGFHHTCAVTVGGEVRCWGVNEFGQLGDNTTEDRKTPVVVEGIDGALEVAAGESHTCALLLNQKVFCWGSNEYGQLCHPQEYTQIPEPALVYIELPGMVEIAAISA